MPIPCAVLMCHAPIVIPQIAGRRAPECARTTAAMSQAASLLLRHAPDVLVIISPHTPRDRRRFGVVASPSIRGDFGRFGAPTVGLSLPGSPRAARALEQAAGERGLGVWQPPGDDLDHGALVPLHFMVEAGWHGPTLLLALPYPGTGTEASMGLAIASTAQRLGERWCVLASGDMSHRLQPDAPAGYHPAAHEFDAAFRASIEAGDLRRACSVDPALRDIAAEDVVDSTSVAAAALGYVARGHRGLDYEAPFGVGYLAAVLHDSLAPGVHGIAGPPVVGERTLLSIARDAIAATLRGESYEPPSLPEPWVRPRGVFVTLREQGELRGCIGHVEPQCSTLAHEIASCAISAALHDPRFAPMRSQEFERSRIEISLLSPSEPVAHLDQLDPERYGIVVSAGPRRGVLLPHVAGIRDAHDQLRIALRKAGLNGEEAELRLERFEIQKLEEPPLAPHGSGRSAGPSRHGLH